VNEQNVLFFTFSAVQKDVFPSFGAELLKTAESSLHKNLINLVNESLGDKQYFVTQTKALIGKDIPTLQRDLGWGDYLTNLAKEICNTVVKAFSLGCHGGFFDTKKSDAVKEAEKLQDEVLSAQSFLEIK
jgi:hypothetical protein